jgi:molybdopterin synthase sulfur carrier subunit
MLSDAVPTAVSHQIAGDTVEEALADLFARHPGLRNHILDDSGAIRPHVSVFVDGLQADLASTIHDGSEIRVLHAVSGG